MPSARTRDRASGKWGKVLATDHWTALRTVRSCKHRSRTRRSSTRWADCGLLLYPDQAGPASGEQRINRQWPATQARSALLSVAADPNTRSPMRLAEASPWWDQPMSPPAARPANGSDEARLEHLLDDTDGLRPVLQAKAREQLAGEGTPPTRLEVMRRAVHLLRESPTAKPLQAVANMDARSRPCAP